MSVLRYTYLALGDSYTVGEGLPPDQSFPHQLVKMMNRSACFIDEPVVIAKTGWTTSELMEGINQAGVQPCFDLVTLLIGVNNQYRGLPEEEYRTDFRALLGTAIRYAGGNNKRVFVLSIPDWSATPFAAELDRPGISLAIDRFNQINRSITETNEVSYIDITKGSRRSPGDPSMVTSDNLHPSPGEYQQWAEELAFAVKKSGLSFSVNPA